MAGGDNCGYEKRLVYDVGLLSRTHEHAVENRTNIKNLQKAHANMESVVKEMGKEVSKLTVRLALILSGISLISELLEVIGK